MDVCGQTLVLVDNDLTVSEVNRKLTDATLKYMFYHSPDNRAYSFNLYEHGICGQEEYVTDVNDLACKVDTLSYEAKDCNIVDTLTEVIKSWQESDFACRDIVVVTDGLEGAEINHEKEELYYLIENTEYPVYVIFLNQENNTACKKTLSAIATTSGGELFESEFPGDDAEVDKQITQKLFAKMDEYAADHWGVYQEAAEKEEVGESEKSSVEATDSESPAEAGIEEGEFADKTENPGKMGNLETAELTGEAEELENAELTGETSEVIWRAERGESFLDSPYVFVVAGIGLALALLLAIFGSFAVMKLRRRKEDELKGLSGKECVTEYNAEDRKFAGDDDGRTVVFGDLEDEMGYDAYATRILSNDRGITVKLIDSGDEENCYTIYLGGDMSIGRKVDECDVVIEGDDALSKCHCKLSLREGEVYVKDLDSSNGTFVNGKKIAGSVLREGDELKIGSRSYCVRFA